MAEKYRLAAACSILTLTPGHVCAAGAGMPWEAPLDQLLSSITAPWLKLGTVAAIVVVGLLLGFSGTGGFFRRVMYVVFGLLLACAGASWGLPFSDFPADGWCDFMKIPLYAAITGVS